MKIRYTERSSYDGGAILFRFYYNQKGAKYINEHAETTFCIEILYRDDLKDDLLIEGINPGQYFAQHPQGVTTCLEKLIEALKNQGFTGLLVISNEVTQMNASLWIGEGEGFNGKLWFRNYMSGELSQYKKLT